MPAPQYTLEQAIWRRITPTGFCWLWEGATNHAGYGIFWRNNTYNLAHRAVYVELVGVIAEGLSLDHLCRVRSCVNPDHLEPVTTAKNIARGYSPCAINARKDYCKSGHEFNQENTYNRPKGGRMCRVCNRAAQATYSRRKLELKVAD